MKKLAKAIAFVILRGLLVTAIVTALVVTAWAVTKGLAYAFGAIELGLEALTEAVMQWDWFSRVIAVGILVGMTYILEAILARKKVA